MEEEEIFFKRFSAEKQDQVRGLVEYATLMGLSGKDLVSIGGKLDRLKTSAEKNRNLEIIRSFALEPIGDDRKRKGNYLEERFDRRFKIKTVNGTYRFDSAYSGWKIQNVATGVIVHHNPDNYAYEMGNPGWSRRSRYAMILDIANGHFQLNF
jgi:hypothetical protein